VGSRGGVERLLHRARLDAHAAVRDVDLADRVEVARVVEHDPAAAGGLARQARAAAARDDGHAVLGRDRDGRRDVAGAARERDEQRLDRVHARVGGVQVARVGVRAHVTRQRASQRGLQLSGVRLPAHPEPGVLASSDRQSCRLLPAA
jgi:hypothetical protein